MQHLNIFEKDEPRLDDRSSTPERNDIAVIEGGTLQRPAAD
jgi:hypothetical protein